MISWLRTTGRRGACIREAFNGGDKEAAHQPGAHHSRVDVGQRDAEGNASDAESVGPAFAQQVPKGQGEQGGNDDDVGLPCSKCIFSPTFTVSGLNLWTA